jgi:hypothetical protein
MDGLFFLTHCPRPRVVPWSLLRLMLAAYAGLVVALLILEQQRLYGVSVLSVHGRAPPSIPR